MLNEGGTRHNPSCRGGRQWFFSVVSFCFFPTGFIESHVIYCCVTFSGETWTIIYLPHIRHNGRPEKTIPPRYSLMSEWVFDSRTTWGSLQHGWCFMKLQPWSFLHDLQTALPVAQSPLPSSCSCLYLLGERPVSLVSFRSFLGFVSYLLAWPRASFISGVLWTSSLSVGRGGAVSKSEERATQHLQHNSH